MKLRRIGYGIVGMVGIGLGISLGVLHYQFGLHWRVKEWPHHHRTMGGKIITNTNTNINTINNNINQSIDNDDDNNNNNKEKGKKKEENKKKIKILSHNIWFSFFVGGKKREARLQILLNGIRRDDPDVVCLQESFIFGMGPFWMMDSEFQTMYHYLVKHLGYHYVTNPFATLPLIGQNSGLIIFSKIPFEEISNSTFHPDTRRWFTQKGFLSTRFSVGSKNLLLMNIHLEHRNMLYKKQQIQQIKEYVQSLQQDKSKNMEYECLLGDFNICSNYTLETFGDKIASKRKWDLTEMWDNWMAKKEDKVTPLIEVNRIDDSKEEKEREKKVENNEEKKEYLYDILMRVLTNELNIKHDLFKERGQIDRTYRVMPNNPREENEACYDHVFMNDALYESVTNLQVVDYQEDGVIMSDHYGLMFTVYL